MRRLLTSVLTMTSLPAVAVVLPVVARPVPAPHPVRPVVHTVPVTAAATARAHATAAAPTTPAASPTTVADTGPQSTASFDLVGAGWDRGTLAAGQTVQVRVHTGGRWSSWQPLSPGDGGPDAGSSDARAAARTDAGRVSSEPVWVGRSDGVELRVLSTAATPAPAHLKAVLVDGGHSAADAAVGAPATLGGAGAHAATPQPQIYTRAQWGADESLRQKSCPSGPDYGTTIKMGFVHHTDTPNDYSAADVPGILRAIYAYHVQSNGWCDIGYNYLIDRFGRIWEGRYGGIDRPVIGAHTGGFNTDTFGVSLIGTYSTTTPSSAMQQAVEHLFAWRLGEYHRDPTGTTTITAEPFSGSRFPAGSPVTLHTISGHRDADTTTCPGDAAYALLPAIREAAGFLIASHAVAPPTASGPALAPLHAPVVLSGTAGPGDPVTLWLHRRGQNGFAPVGTVNADGSGHYRARFFATDDFRWYVTSTGGRSAAGLTQVAPTVHGPGTAAYGESVALTGTALPGQHVTLWLHPRDSRGFWPVGTVLADAAGSFTARMTMSDDYRWYVTNSATRSADGLTRVAPTAHGPGTATRGAAVHITGTAVPHQRVTLWLHRQWTHDYVAVGAVTADASGRYDARFFADVDYRWYVTMRGLPSPAGLTQLAR